MIFSMCTYIESGQWFLFLSHSISLAFRERQFHGNRVKQGHWLFSGLFLRHHMGDDLRGSTGYDWLKKLGTCHVVLRVADCFFSAFTGRKKVADSFYILKSAIFGKNTNLLNSILS